MRLQVIFTMVPRKIVASPITKMVDLYTCCKICVGMDTRIPCNRVHHSFFKLERILILMIQRTKGIKIENFKFYNTFQHFGSNVFKKHLYLTCIAVN